MRRLASDAHGVACPQNPQAEGRRPPVACDEQGVGAGEPVEACGQAEPAITKDLKNSDYGRLQLAHHLVPVNLIVCCLEFTR